MAEEVNIHQILIEFESDFVGFIQCNPKLEACVQAEILKTNPNITIPLVELRQYSIEIYDRLIEKPDEIIEYMKIIILRRYCGIPHKKITIQLASEVGDTKIRELPGEKITKLASIRARISRTSDVEQIVKTTMFGCKRCDARMSIMQDEDKDAPIKEPVICPNGHRKSFFVVDEMLEEIQTISIEEIIEEENVEKAIRITVVLEGELCIENKNKLRAGEEIIVTGIIKNKTKIVNRSPTNTKIHYMKAKHIKYCNDNQVTIDDDDEKKIVELSKTEDIMATLSSMTFPNIEGNMFAKKALILYGVGGRGKEIDLSRQEINVLFIGDAATSKSKLGELIRKVLEKVQYAGGKTSSAVGLSAAVIRDEVSGQWVVESGLFPLAHQGHIIIDELDKLPDDDKDVLHEAMERQKLSVVKAGQNTTFKCEAGVLGIANPKYSMFSPHEDLAKQFNMRPTLINRFDIIVIFKDIPEKKFDGNVCDKLWVKKIEESKELVKKYIHYARKITPSFTEEAKNTLKESYLALRDYQTTENRAIPINARYRDALARISIAITKLHLSEIVTKEYVEEAKKIIFESLIGIAIDPETGKFDVNIIEIGKSTSKINRIAVIEQTLIDLKEADIMQIHRMLKEKGIDIQLQELESHITRMLRDGLIFERTRGIYRPL